MCSCFFFTFGKICTDQNRFFYVFTNICEEIIEFLAIFIGSVSSSPFKFIILSGAFLLNLFHFTGSKEKTAIHLILPTDFK